MRAWIGKSIVGIALVHLSFGLFAFRAQLVLWAEEGLWNTVNGQVEREFPFWFLSFGLLALILGSLVDWIERRVSVFPSMLGWSLLAFTVLLVFVMPISGGWLMLVPAVGALRRGRGRAAGEASRLLSDVLKIDLFIT